MSFHPVLEPVDRDAAREPEALRSRVSRLQSGVAVCLVALVTGCAMSSVMPASTPESGVVMTAKDWEKAGNELIASEKAKTASDRAKIGKSRNVLRDAAAKTALVGTGGGIISALLKATYGKWVGAATSLAAAGIAFKATTKSVDDKTVGCINSIDLAEGEWDRVDTSDTEKARLGFVTLSDAVTKMRVSCPWY